MDADTRGVVVAFCGVVFSLFSIALFGSGIGEVSRQKRTSISPSSDAFSIWGVIYTTTLLSSLFQFGSAFNFVPFPSLVRPFLANVSLCVSFVFAGLWIPAFTSGTKEGILASSLLLLVSLISSLHSVLYPKRRELIHYFLLEAPVSLYSGWLFVAFTLSLFIFVKDYFDVSLPFLAVIPTSLAVIILSLHRGDPLLIFPLFFALCYIRDAPKQPYIWLLAVLVCSQFISAFLKVEQYKKIGELAR